MKLSQSQVEFETEVGNVVISRSMSMYHWEFISGSNWGLHESKPLPSFDKAYKEVLKAVKNQIENLRIEQIIENE